MSESSDIGSLRLTLAIYVVILAAKMAAYLASGVMAVFAEALHTLSDIFISAFLLVAAVYSCRPADAVHMFGYGRAQNIAALVAATLFISFTSFELYREPFRASSDRTSPSMRISRLWWQCSPGPCWLRQFRSPDWPCRRHVARPPRRSSWSWSTTSSALLRRWPRRS